MKRVDGNGKRKNYENNAKNPDLLHNKYHPASTGIWTRDCNCGKPAR